MAKDKEEPTAKLCSACVEELPKEQFSKKQWLGSIQKQRRCKDCVESEKEIDTTATATQQLAANVNSSRTSNKNKGNKKKDKPAFAGNQKGRYEPAPAGTRDNLRGKLASNICGWCGKSEENKTFMECTACRNILYCSKTCQKASWPEHKLVCDQMKKDRKNTKGERKAEKKGAFIMSEASGAGYFFLDYKPKIADGSVNISMAVYNGELRGYEKPGQYFATDASRDAMRKLLGAQKFQMFRQHLEEQTRLTDRDSFKRTEMFTDVDELNPVDQFLLSCGPLFNIDRAKLFLPVVLNQISMSGLKPDGTIPNIGDITVRGYGLNALEWAARRGNYDIAEWLATDARTKIMITRTDSAPVAWACYTNKVELAKMLVQHGANSHATTEVVFSYKPATHLAGENGNLLAVKYLVEECGHDIHECDTVGHDMRASLRVNNKVWAEVAGCVAVDEYAKSKGVQGEIIRKSKNKTESSRNKNAQQQPVEKLSGALKQLELAGGKEEESDSEENDDDNPGDYLNELLAVGDARYELGQYAKAGGIYYRAYYAAMGPYINNPAIFPIAHKMVQAWMRSNDEHYINQAHGMAQQNCNMPCHPPYTRNDLKEVEAIMRKKGMKIQRFGF